jgi:hypothetical protein
MYLVLLSLFSRSSRDTVPLLWFVKNKQDEFAYISVLEETDEITFGRERVPVDIYYLVARHTPSNHFLHDKRTNNHLCGGL